MERPLFKEKQSLSKEIVHYMKLSILNGIWSPGDRIVETKLAKELGISQTPVREAINRLAGEGIITILPNKGAVVRNLTARDIFEIYSIRAVIEGLAIRLATLRADAADISELERFFGKMKEKVFDNNVKTLSPDAEYIHEFIYKLANHSQLLIMHESISFKIALANRILSFNYTKEQEVEQHWPLVVALKKGDPDYAEKVMREHIRQAYLQFVKSNKFDNHEQLDEMDWF
ncbi:GntR family transcriptional regulator [Paenibacillus humicola]|uniref:GntR family transcriptional regulator n=1 Tax=Paenibacillus humicola TaxID=3110540 RepID=UPI00237B159A|nr:GntR family transcriptional regulator [Paenibacillus humicola]